MQLIEQSCEWVYKPLIPLEIIELAGRTCYRSEHRICEDSAKKFVKGIIKSGHESVIEHVSASVRFITNRGVTHEICRHRLFSYSQESTRYVKYLGDMEFIKPVWFGENEVNDKRFIEVCEITEKAYKEMLSDGWRAEQAREILPNGLKTEIVMSGNMRNWRHFFKLRTTPACHPQMRSLAKQCLNMFKEEIPVIFDNI
jgi:thymidylate synthase (FAD)